MPVSVCIHSDQDIQNDFRTVSRIILILENCFLSGFLLSLSLSLPHSLSVDCCLSPLMYHVHVCIYSLGFGYCLLKHYDLLTLLALFTHSLACSLLPFNCSIWRGTVDSNAETDTINIMPLFVFIYFSIRTPVIDCSSCTNKQQTI